MQCSRANDPPILPLLPLPYPFLLHHLAPPIPLSPLFFFFSPYPSPLLLPFFLPLILLLPLRLFPPPFSSLLLLSLPFSSFTPSSYPYPFSSPPPPPPSPFLLPLQLVDLRHYRGNMIRCAQKKDGAENMSRLMKIMRKMNIEWTPERCTLIIEKVRHRACVRA